METNYQHQLNQPLQLPSRTDHQRTTSTFLQPGKLIVAIEFLLKIVFEKHFAGGFYI